MKINKITLKKDRTRKFIKEDEIQQLIQATVHTRHPIRNKAMIILMYNHGLRTSELCELRWSDVDLEQKTIMIRRKKNGKNILHPLLPSDVSSLQELKNISDLRFPYIFKTDQKRKFERHGIKWIFYMLGAKCNISTHFSSRSLRHAKGVWLRENGERMEDIADWLGHKNIASTQIYTEMAVTPRFKDMNKGSMFA